MTTPSQIVLDGNNKPALRITANDSLDMGAYENENTVDANGNPAVRVTCEDGSVGGGAPSDLQSQVNDGLSILLSAETLTPTVNSQTTISLSELSAMNIDGRPSYQEAGATVFDNNGSIGIVDQISGGEAIITTVVVGKCNIEPTSTNQSMIVNLDSSTVLLSGVVSVGTVGAGTGSTQLVTLPTGITLADGNYIPQLTAGSSDEFCDIVCEAKSITTTGFTIAYKNIDTNTASNVNIGWMIVAKTA